MKNSISRIFSCLCVTLVVWSAPLVSSDDVWAESSRTQLAPEHVARLGKVADRAIDALIKGDAKTFKEMLSPVTIRMEQRGATAIDTIISERFIPFFSDYLKPGTTEQTFHTYRRLDNTHGVGFARSFVAKDASEHFFVIFILEEDGKPIVGNLILNKNFADFN